jgi:hypothetical protein
VCEGKSANEASLYTVTHAHTPGRAAVGGLPAASAYTLHHTSSSTQLYLTAATFLQCITLCRFKQVSKQPSFIFIMVHIVLYIDMYTFCIEDLVSGLIQRVFLCVFIYTQCLNSIT